MPKIFISYHRSDSDTITQTLYLLLCQYFGTVNVVFDGNNKPDKVGFSQHFADEIAKADVVLVIMGRKWGNLMRGRANQETDSVRIEIENALRQKKIIIPVLVKDANTPDYSRLPDSFRDLQWIKAIELRGFSDAEGDFQHLLIAIEDALKIENTPEHNLKNPGHKEKIPSFKDLISKPASKIISPDDDATQLLAERIKGLSVRNSKFNSFDWVEIPSGDILVKGDRFSYLPEDFQKKVFVETFSITKYPVMNLQYAPYVSASGNVPEYWTNAKFNKPHQPVVGVSWFDVMTYCDWLSARLGYEVIIPTENQWQRAAQGDDGREYPWGNRWNKNFANTDEKINHTTPVHQYPEGASPYGLMDMAGNVWEWCFVEPEMEEFVNSSIVLRGGSWLNYSMFATVNARNIRLPNMDYSDVGFRLSRL